MSKKNNAKEVSMKSVRNGAKCVLDLTMGLKAVCAQINSVMGEEFEHEGTTMTVREWFALMDYKWSAKGITPSALAKVWGEKMNIDEEMASWRRIPATVGEGKDAKRVYEWDDKKGEFRAVAEYHLVKCDKWSARLVINGLIDSWNYAAVTSKLKKNTEHINGIKKFYVTSSKKATRKNVNTAMVEVKKDEITF